MLSHRLRHRIHIQLPVKTQDPQSGEELTGWQTYLLASTPLNNLPAEVLTGAGREFIAADAKQSETTARINLRWFPIDISLFYQCRILWNGRVYDIHSIETDLTGRQEWRLRCKDGVNQGA
ncbi:phage head closure protein [Shewanella inventionis]|uniref:phage head closure protein n=1 Tax=Shewanella inventionis TaxID=1738770 RepID=UPI001CBEBBD2|nr:phage head closure protein [Shewanella inventionis]UAL42123.1 phage head closure protein [Shewanella inventionis]